MTVSLATKEQLLRHGISGERITVVHNAVPVQPLRRIKNDASILRQKKIDLGVSPDEKLILCAGRLSKEKGQIDMVGAIASFAKAAS